MDPRVVAVLRLLAEKESSDDEVTSYVNGQPTETVTQQHAEVIELRPEEGILAVRHGQSVARLLFDEAEVLAFLRDAGEIGEEVWGYPMSDEEAAARFLSIHLDECIATREPHESGWWTYRAGGFDPIPPWESGGDPADSTA